MAATNDHGRRLAAAAQALAIELDDGKASALLGYVAQLERWNRTYNLTAVRNADQMLTQHLFDSLAVATPLANILDKNTVNAPRIMDVGSGAGLPGAVLAIMYPQWQVYCVDAVEKKTAFIRQIASVLRLPNLQAVHGRVEALEPLAADIVISRAFASLADFAKLAGPHAAAGGYLAAMKGREPQDEIATLEQQTNWRANLVQTLLVPELNAQRCLVWLSRQGTP